MTPDLVRAVMGWLGGLALVAAAVGAIYLTGKINGRNAERAIWQEKMLVAERAARQTEVDLAGIAEASAKRIAAKEAALHEQALRQDAAWRALLAGLPRCRVPRAVGVQLDAAAGLHAAPGVAGTPEPAADGAALDALVDVADSLDACRQNAVIGRRNIDALIEAREWYTGLRERVNSGATP